MIKVTDKWSKKKIKEWVFAQDWYQTIKITDDIVTPGAVDASWRFKMMNLGDLTGKTVLDVGCNSGQICIETKRLGASRVVGIDIYKKRLSQAITLAEILNLDIEFKEIGILESESLGQFDIVFCIAVLTEVPDLISSLLILKNITKEILYLELSISPISSIPLTMTEDLKIRRTNGRCYLREIRGNRWSLVPDMRFLETLLGDKFKIQKLGKSSRYTLLRCDVKK
ncbi:MAG: class I SAM-dependent methyltransferase [Promethearchaeota archaeon]